MAIEHALQRLLARLREAGAGATAADLPDAARAARLVGLADRDRLRDALRLVLARTREERARFDEAFDLEFGSAPGAAGSTATRRAARPTGRPGGAGLGGRDAGGGGRPPATLDRRAGPSPVRRGLPPQDRTPGGAARRRAASHERESPRDPALALDAAPPHDRGEGTFEPRGDGTRESDAKDPTRPGRVAARERAADRRDRGDEPGPRSTRAATRWAAPHDRPHASPDGPLGTLDLSGELDSGLEAAAARELFRRLTAARWARRRRPDRSPRRGAIDVQRALRQSLASRGVPLAIPRRRPGLRPPRLVFLVDASWSCARASALLLAAVGRLAALARTVEIALFVDVPVAATREVRAWAAGHLAPVASARRPVPGTFVRAAPDRAGFDAVLARFADLDPRRASDYGRALERFVRRFRPWLAPARSTVLAIVGDARSNQFPPCAWFAQELRAQVRRVAWLVTEPAERWGTGDSRLLDYAPHADLVHEATTLDGLVAGLAAVLRLARRTRQGV